MSRAPVPSLPLLCHGVLVVTFREWHSYPCGCSEELSPDGRHTVAFLWCYEHKETALAEPRCWGECDGTP